MWLEPKQRLESIISLEILFLSCLVLIECIHDILLD